MTVLPEANMGVNLAQTMLFYLVCSASFAYLASFALGLETEGRETDQLTLFRFVATISLLTFMGSIVQHAMWFKNRITGHVIESMVYSIMAGGIFALFWPAG